MSSAADTVRVLEQFYGEALTLNLLKLVQRTPLDQLLELASRLQRHNRLMEQTLSSRVYRDYAVPSSHAEYATDEICVHDSTFLNGANHPLGESPGFKQLVLLGDRVLLPDSVLDWAETTVFLESVDQGYSEEETAQRLTRALRRLLPLRPLLDAGAVVLTASRKNFDFGYAEEFGIGRYNLEFRGTLDPLHEEVYWRDPILAWHVVHSLGLIEPWELEALDLADPMDFQETASYLLGRNEDDLALQAKLPQLVRLAHGPDASLRQVEDAVQLTMLTRDLRMRPMTSSTLVRRHLTRASMVALNGRLHTEMAKEGGLERAVRLHMPSLEHVSLADLARLRTQEDLYFDVRIALTTLVENTQVRLGATYEEYVSAVEAASSDLVLPLVHRLQKQATRTRWTAKLAGYGAAGLIKLGLSGVAMSIGGPAGLATSKVAGAAGRAVGDTVFRRTSKGLEPTELACSILLSTLAVDAQ